MSSFTNSQPSCTEGKAAYRIVECARNDIVSYAEIKQILHDFAEDCLESEINEYKVFHILLEFGMAVGRAVNDEKNKCVRFVAWRGDQAEKLRRLSWQLEEMKRKNDYFSLWFCLARNVDSYE